MDICNAIAARRLVSFDYDDHHRVVQPAAAGPHATTALAADLADVEQALAVLRAAPGPTPIDGDDFLDVITELLTQLRTPRS